MFLENNMKLFYCKPCNFLHQVAKTCYQRKFRLVFLVNNSSDFWDLKLFIVNYFKFVFSSCQTKFYLVVTDVRCILFLIINKLFCNTQTITFIKLWQEVQSLTIGSTLCYAIHGGSTLCYAIHGGSTLCHAIHDGVDFVSCLYFYYKM